MKQLRVIPDDVARRHGRRPALNVVLLSLLVFHGNAALKEYVAVTELSPGRIFHLLVLPAGRSRAPKFSPSTKASFGRQYQRL